MLTNRASLRRLSLAIALKKTTILSLITVLVAISSLWLGSQRVQSASSETVVAPAPPGPPPLVSIDLPDEVLIGEDFEFEVKFMNNTGAVLGYGPYIELYLPARGPDSNAPDGISGTNQKCDGISFLSASTSFANPPVYTLTPKYDQGLSTSSNDLDCPNLYTLPFVGMTSVPLTPSSADYQLVVIELPFGSFYAGQPDVSVNVKAHLSDFADRGVPLTIYARGGFRYGSNTPLDDHPADPLLESVVDSDQTTPAVFKLKKAYLGPENEAVSGPNFINYYKLKYELTADIADQQTVNKMLVTDILPVNLQFAGNVQVKIQGNNANPVATCSTNSGPYDVVISTPPSGPNGTLTVELCSAITGLTAANDVVITFDFFIPEFDANGQVILDKDCKNSPVPVKNDIKATGDWDPLDPRDPNPNDPAGTTIPVPSDLTNVDHVLDAKCIAIQKKVEQRLPDTGGPGLTPGDTLRYELNFQVSDYRTIGKIVITDLLSDGQLLVGSPTLTFIGDQFGSYNNKQFTPATYIAVPDQTISCGGVKGGIKLTLKVSSALAAAATPLGHPRHQNGILTGGHAAGAPTVVPAWGQIVFYARIQDTFTYQYPFNPIKRYVDKDDPLNNCVSIEGLVYGNQSHPPLPSITLGNTTDGSGTQVRIAKDKPKKTVYAVKRGSSIICGPSTPCLNLPGTPQDVRPGDKVTFRIEYPIPSGDAEALTIDDWIPSPAFDVGDPDADSSTTGPFWPTAAVPNCLGSAPYVPAPGRACRLTFLQATPGHSLTKIPSLVSGTSNNLLFNYGPSFFNTLNTSRNIDLLFTITATNKPFADGLYLTNEARENELNTFGDVTSQVTIAQVKLREPKLRIRKGVIASNNPNTQFSHPASPQTLPDPTALAPANATLSLTGISSIASTSAMVSSNDLGTTGVLDSNIPGGVDANDIVTFAITVENLGGAPAYDVKVEDIIPHDSNGNPTCFTIVPNSFQVKRGTGATVNPFLYNLVFPTPTGGFTITSKPLLIPINAYDATSGKNIVIVTFQAKLLANIGPGCCENKAEIKHYANQLNGPNFVTANLTPPFDDSAQVCVKPKAEKCVVATSEVHTQANNSITGSPQPPQVTIGEIVRYHLTVTLPEGVSPFFRVTDHLPPGMTYMPGTAKVAFVSTGGITSSAPGLSGANLPDPVNYKLGCLNPTPAVVIPSVTPASFTPGDDPTFNLGILTNSDNDNSLEYVIIEFNALVNNVATNVDTVTLKNNYDIFIGKGLVPTTIATSNDSDVIIVEPNLTMTKTVAPNPAVKGQTLTYTVQYTNTGTADAFDVELKDTLPAGLTFGTIAASCPVTNSTSNTIIVNCALIPKAPNPGSTVIVSYQALANPETCPATLENRATLTWTSLPGPQGTIVNATGSSTPGNSGALDGERDGVTPLLTLNDYAATISAPVKIDCPCCLQISNETVACNPNGSFNYTFTLTNLSGTTVSAVNLSPAAGVTMTPGSISIPPLASGSSTTLTVTISGPGAVSGAAVCFSVGVGGRRASDCKIQHCITLPRCRSACATPPPGMVAFWPLDETSGSIVHSIVGNHDGTTFPGPIGTGGSPSVASAPKVGSALFFGAARAEVPDDPALDFGKGDFSIDAWVRSYQSTLLSAVVDKLDTSTTTHRGYAFFVQNGMVQLRIGDGLNTATYQSSNTFLADGTWRHVAVTMRRVGGTPVGQFYIDGVPAGASFTPLAIDVDSSAKLLIGNYRLGNNACSCEVSLDEIELFNTAVSPDSIKSIYQAGKNGKCKETISGLKFNDLNGNGVRDQGEQGLSNWTITATDSSGNVQTTSTDSQGNYSFTGPTPGTYTVSEVHQSGWTQTAPSTGSYNVTLPANQVPNLTFGNRQSNKCDLAIRKEVKPNPVVSGQQASFIVTVTNVTNIPCHGPITVTESLIPVSAAGPGWTCAGAVCTYPAAINAGQSVSVTYTYNVTAEPGSSVTNCARQKNPDDTNSANDEACVEVRVDPKKSPDLTIKKVVQCTPGPATFSCKIGFTITNNGPGSFSGFLGLQDVFTPIPTALFLAPGSSNPPGWNCSISAPGTIACGGTSPVTLGPSGSTSFSVEVYSPIGDFKNCASVKGYTQPPFTVSTLIQESDFNNNESCVSTAGSLSRHYASPPNNRTAWWPLVASLIDCIYQGSPFFRVVPM